MKKKVSYILGILILVAVICILAVCCGRGTSDKNTQGNATTNTENQTETMETQTDTDSEKASETSEVSSEVKETASSDASSEAQSSTEVAESSAASSEVKTAAAVSTEQTASTESVEKSTESSKDDDDDDDDSNSGNQESTEVKTYEILPLIPAEELTADNAVSNALNMIDELNANWKEQLPVLRDGSTTSVKEVGKSTDIPFEGYYDEWFYYDPADESIVFYTLVQGAKTSNTTYTRSELREMIGTKTSENWAWEGYHTLEVTEKVNQVSANGKTMVCQVHAIYPDGSNGPVPLKVIYQGNEKRLEVTFTLRADANATKAYYFDNVELGQEFSVKMEFIDGAAYVTVESEGRIETYGHDFLAADPAGWGQYNNYFKAGNYIQDNTDMTEGAGSVVRLYELKTSHDYDSANNPIYTIEDLQLTQSDLTMQVGERTQLVTEFTPVQTTNKNVTWKVEDGTDYVAVDKDGYVIAIKEGTAKVSVTSEENPALKSTCTITVTEKKETTAEIIYKQTFDKDGQAVTLADLVADGVILNGESMISIEGEDNPYMRIQDTDAAVSGKIDYDFTPVNGPVTLSMKIKVNSIDIKEANTAKPKVSFTYLDLNGINEEGETPTVLGRMRNNGDLASTVVDANKNRWGVSSAYLDAPLNTDKTYFTYDEWVEITMITTPADGSADANTTTYYVNGYKVGNQLENKTEQTFVSRLEIAVGTKDLMDISVDDIIIYNGKVVPESRNTTAPTRIDVDTVPAKMSVGDSYQITAAAYPEDAYEELKYEVVSGEAIALNNEGYLIAVKEGTSVIRVSSALEGAEVYTEVTIEVVDAANFVAVTSISLTDVNGETLTDKLLMAPEKTEQLYVAFNPTDATDKSLLYEVVSGDDIISVSDTGLITALKSGNATLRVTSAGNASAYCELQVVVVKDFVAGTVLFKDSFDAALDTTVWTIGSQNAGNTTTTVTDGILSFVDNNGGGQPKSYVTFEPVRGAVTINFKLRIDDDKILDNGKTSSIRISVGAGDITKTASETFTIKNTAKVTDGVISDRQFQYSLPNNADGTGVFQKVSSFELDEWYDITMIVRTNDGSDKANTSDLYINGTLVTPEAGTQNKVVYEVLDKICFTTGSSDLTSYSIDDLVIKAGECVPGASEEGEQTATLVRAQDFEDSSKLNVFTGSTLPDVPGIRYWTGTDIVSAIVDSGDTAHGNVLHLKDENTGAQSRVMYTFEQMSGTFTIEFDMKVVADTYEDGSASSFSFTLGDSGIGLVNSDAYEIFRLKWNPAKSNALQLRGGKSGTDAVAESTVSGFAYTTGTWQNYKLVVDTVLKTVSVYVDDELVTDAGKIRITGFDNTFTGIDHIIFSTVKAEKFEGMIDNFNIYQGAYTE